jgi:hypothetical protein
MKLLLTILKTLETAIPINWDRYTSTDEGFYVVYGWIPRSDGDRDFLMITWDKSEPDEAWYTTSSAKYSRIIMRVLTGSDDDHNDCRNIKELFAMANEVEP